MKLATAWALLLTVSVASGCGRNDEPEWSLRREVLGLPEKPRQQIQDYLVTYTGTAANPKMLGDETLSRQHLLLGAAVYYKYCAQCHGESGDGGGRAAEYLDPPPRDYRTGVFKFTSTPNGAKPVRDDLIRTVRNGAKGTAMPSFGLLQNEEIEAVVDYVLVLTHRGELEDMLLREAQSEDEIDPAAVPEYVERILGRWAAARQEIVTPVSPYVPYSDESVEIGKKAFLTETAGCYKCHGPDGRGLEIANVLGPHGQPIRSADITSGMLRGGNRPIDIYRRIYSGINGSPMPSFALQLKDDPPTVWHLVHYVEYLAGTRRRELAKQQAEYANSARAAGAADATNAK